MHVEVDFGTVVDPVEHLDFEPECVVEDGHGATHVAYTSCGCAVLYCEGHIKNVRENVEILGVFPYLFELQCDGCDRVGVQLVRIEPLNKGGSK